MDTYITINVQLTTILEIILKYLSEKIYKSSRNKFKVLDQFIIIKYLQKTIEIIKK